MKKIMTIVAFAVCASMAHAVVVPGAQNPTGLSTPFLPSSNQAQGQLQGQVQSQTQSQGQLQGQNVDVEVKDGSSDYKSNVYVAPAPVTATPVPVSTSPCILTKSESFAIGWSFLSVANSKQSVNTICVKERTILMLIAQCQYRSAALLQKSLIEEIAPELKDTIVVPDTVQNASNGRCNVAAQY